MDYILHIPLPVFLVGDGVGVAVQYVEVHTRVSDAAKELLGEQEPCHLRNTINAGCHFYLQEEPIRKNRAVRTNKTYI